MSGAVAAHAAYNGSGTQGLAVTNKVSGADGDVQSVFWNKNDTTRQLLYGSALVEIQSSGSNTLNFGGSRLFTINNDIDCLGDIYLQLKASFPNSDAIAATNEGPVGGGNFRAAPAMFATYDLVDRVEFQVGTQIWQTLEKEDIRVVNSTELDSSAFLESSLLTSNNTPETTWIVLPSFSKTLSPYLAKFNQHAEDGYAMAAAPHQSVKIKVVFRDAYSSTMTVRRGVIIATATAAAGKVTQGAAIPPSYFSVISDHPYVVDSGPTAKALSSGDADVVGAVTEQTFAAPTITLNECKLYAKQIVMCNEEREAMKSMPLGMPKRLKMTQNAHITDVGSANTKTIDLDHFSLYASHIIISGNVGSEVGLKSVELKLNSSSFSGVLPAVLLDAVASDTMGLYANKVIFLSSETDGSQAPIPDAATNISTAALGLAEFRSHGGFGTFVFPLASRAYGGSSVPLNRFDSIRLVLTFSGAAVTSSNSFINVTCVGKTTALFKDGAASLAMY